MSAENQEQSYAFQAEINQLLSLIIHTFYSNKDVFLRELISNASDAIDKIRYQSLTDQNALANSSDLLVRIEVDKQNGILKVRDTGIGMTKDDLIKNLGTIAHSGTKAFMEAMKNASTDAVSLIGQFGVGFYAAYLVADKVMVRTKHNSDGHYIWESNASGSFTIRSDNNQDLTRGTEIVLFMKEDQKEYLEESKIRDIIKTHSEFIAYPIQLLVEKEEEVVEEKEVEGDEDGNVQEQKDETVDKKKVVKLEWETLNKQKPIWTRKPDEVSEEDYKNFYKTITQDWDDHLKVKHFSVDGQLQFTSLLYVPKHAPYDMFTGASKKRSNIKLYVRRVFIMDDCTELIPEYLSFVKGVVDSDDLPLNISREILQQNRIIKLIRKNVVKKCIETFQELAEDEKVYKDFYAQFSKSLKLGVHEDQANREKLIELMRFKSTKGDFVSFKDYVNRMKEGQHAMYYITGESETVLRESPFIEKLNKKGYEVLFMTDPIDEYLMQHVREYDSKKLVCCSKEAIVMDESEEEKKIHDEKTECLTPLCEELKKLYGERVQNVVVSRRIVDTPCVLVTDTYGWSANMERIMKAQTLGDSNPMMAYMSSRKIMEINPDHKIIQELKGLLDDPEKQALFKSIANLMINTSMIHSGFSLNNPSEYAKGIFSLMQNGIGLDDLENLEDDVNPQSMDDSDQQPENSLETVD